MSNNVDPQTFSKVYEEVLNKEVTYFDMFNNDGSIT